MEVLIPVFVLLVPLISLVLTGMLTHKKDSFVVPRWVSRQVPAEEADGDLVGAGPSAAYRSPGMVTRHERDDAVHATETLPHATRKAASWLRFAVCVASVFVIPVLAVIALEQEPGAVFYLGGPGLLLAGGQLVARNSLLKATPWSPAIVRGIGIWTLLHNVGVIACVYACWLRGAGMAGDWEALGLDGAGVLFVLYAIGSFTLGIVLLRAAGPQRRWLQENSALDLAAVA